MAASRKKSKFDCDTSLFKPEPPTDSRLVKCLFAGREKELHRGFRTLKNELDIGGKRSRRFDKKPWVIHGESRSGKSHLARRILAEFKPHPKRVQLLIPARDRVEAILVMADIFRQVVGMFRERTQDQRLDEPVAGRPDVRLVNNLIERMTLFLDEAQTATLTHERATDSSIEVGGELNFLLGKFLGKFQSKDSSKEARQVILKPPTGETLAELCGVMLETLMDLGLADHLLVLVDDVDLLDPAAPTVQQTRVQRALLTNALCILHAQPGIDVLLTARSWFVYSGKELTHLLDLTQSVLSAEELIAIHDRHPQQFARKAGLQRFLKTEALKAFADEMQELNGLPGVFLQHLFTAFDCFKNDEDFAERDYEWFLDVFRRLMDSLRTRVEPGYAAMQAALQAGQLEIPLAGEQNPFVGTALDNLFVWQSYHNERCYFTSPLMRRLFAPSPAIQVGAIP
jgi:hypothetical protein